MEHARILPPTGYGQWGRDGGCLSRRIFLKGIGIACLGLAPILQACENAFSREGRGNERAGAGSAPRAARPPIDVAAPAGTRTATFALG